MIDIYARAFMIAARTDAEPQAPAARLRPGWLRRARRWLGRHSPA